MNLLKYLLNMKFEAEHNVKNTSKGLFIDEDRFNKVASMIDIYARKTNPYKLLTRKDFLQALQNQDRYYLNEERICLVGCVLEGMVIDTPSSDGKVASCLDTIMENDPLFSKNENIEVMSNSRYCASFNIKDDEYFVEKHAFERFVERTRKSERKKTTSKYSDNLRDHMKRLYRLLKFSVPVDRKNIVLQYIKYKFKETEYRTNNGWIFVIEDNNIFKTCYEVGKISKKGYSLQTMINV